MVEGFARAAVTLQHLNTQLALGQPIDLSQHAQAVSAMVRVASRLDLPRKARDVLTRHPSRSCLRAASSTAALRGQGIPIAFLGVLEAAPALQREAPAVKRNLALEPSFGVAFGELRNNRGGRDELHRIRFTLRTNPSVRQSRGYLEHVMGYFGPPW